MPKLYVAVGVIPPSGVNILTPLGDMLLSAATGAVTNPKATITSVGKNDWSHSVELGYIKMSVGNYRKSLCVR